MKAFTVDWRGELRCRGADEAWLPSGRMTFGTRDARWLDPFSGTARELVLLASTVRQADRLVRRSQSNADHSWGRSLELTIPVTSVSRWNRAQSELEELLNWLTDDSWKLRFERSDDAPAVQESMFDQKPIPRAESVALYSGGLDSVAGAEVWLRRGNAAFLFCLSGDNVHAKHAGSSGRLLEKRHPGNASLLGATHQLRKALVSEKSQRTRGFFFFSLAAAAAHAMQLRRVVTFEAGVGAMNLPMNAAQTGAENTRAMHPRTLLLAQSVFSRLFGTEFSVEAPFMFMTKGELCQAVQSGLSKLARAAYSCDVPQARRPDPFEHCGFCTSCLFRRSALFAALGRKDPTTYGGTPLSPAHAYERDAFLDQAQMFSAWTTPQDVLNYAPSTRFALEYARRTAGLPGESGKALVRLFNKHGDEATALFAHLSRIEAGHSRHDQESLHALG